MKADPPDGPPLRVPRHVAIIMDGNGRWAEARGLPRLAGHEEGAHSVREVVRACRRLGCEALTLYSFSTENWRRPPAEVAGLMDLLRRYLLEERAELLDNAIRLRAIGQVDRLPPHVREPLDELVALTDRPDARMTLVLALSYGGRDELVRAARSLAADCARGALDPGAVDEDLLAARLDTAGLPDPDLLIRTSGEMRVSNFLLWQLAYAEFYVTDVPWPEFREPQLLEAFRAYARRERRFGRTGAQLRGGAGA